MDCHHIVMPLLREKTYYKHEQLKSGRLKSKQKICDEGRIMMVEEEVPMTPIMAIAIIMAKPIKIGMVIKAGIN